MRVLCIASLIDTRGGEDPLEVARTIDRSWANQCGWLSLGAEVWGGGTWLGWPNSRGRRT
jgi:hypothetical protein